MAYGDVGGSVTELVITCRTASADYGPVHIKKGDAVTHLGDYVVTNIVTGKDQCSVFGQAMVGCEQNDTAIPVKVRGICRFRAVGRAWQTAIATPILLDAAIQGAVRPGYSTEGPNTSRWVLKLRGDGTVDVLL